MTKENLDAILEWNCNHKENIGCRGIGRANYLKTFNEITFISFVNNEKKTLNFTENSTEKDIKTEKIEQEDIKQYKLEKDGKGNYKTKTILKLDGINNNIKNRDLIYKKNEFYKTIYDNVVLFLFLNNDKNITIYIDNDQKIETDDVKFDSPITFKIEKKEETKEFTLWYNIKESNQTSFNTYICCDKFNVGKMTTQPLSLNENKYRVEKHKIILILESNDIEFEGKIYKSFIKERIINNHELRKDDSEEGLFNDCYVSWKDVKEETEKQLDELYEKKFPKRIEQLEKQQKFNKEKFLWLSDYFTDLTTTPKEAYSKFVNEQIKILEKQENEIKEEEIEKSMNANLVAYIKWREKIINKFKTKISNKKALEKEIHNLLYKKGKEDTEYEQLNLMDNNIWLLDDRFMSYSYIASNKTIGTITEKIGEKIDKNERPDIVIYKKTAAFEKAVIIEFKKPETNIWDVGKSLEQCFLYAKQLSDSGIKEIHCYSIADINDDVRTIFEGRNFIKLFSTNETEIWQGSFGKINAYIQVITYATILNDAENRNQVFLDIIKRSKGLLDQ